MNQVQYFNSNNSNAEELKNDKLNDVCDDLMKKYFLNTDRISEFLSSK